MATSLAPTADTYLAEEVGAQGASVILIVGQLVPLAEAIRARALFRFDLSAYSDRDIISARLTLVTDDVFTPDGAHDVYAYEVTTTDWTSAAATWIKANASDNWTTQGGDYAATASDTASVDTGQESIEFDLTALASAKRGGNLDIGVLMPEGAEHNNHYITVYSSKAFVEANRPVLTVVASLGSALEWSSLGIPTGYTGAK